MKNEFEQFTIDVVRSWREDKESITERSGLSGIENRTLGDKAERYVLRRVSNLPQEYQGHITVGSQSPADIISFCKRHKFWHFMLIQVKSSLEESNIHKLNKQDEKLFKEFAKYFRKKILKSDLLKPHKTKAIIISYGYSYVHSNKDKNEKIRNKLVDSQMFGFYKKNAEDLNLSNPKSWIKTAHELKK